MLHTCYACHDREACITPKFGSPLVECDCQGLNAKWYLRVTSSATIQSTNCQVCWQAHDVTLAAVVSKLHIVCWLLAFIIYEAARQNAWKPLQNLQSLVKCQGCSQARNEVSARLRGL